MNNFRKSPRFTSAIYQYYVWTTNRIFLEAILPKAELIKALDTLEDPRSSILSYRSQVTRRSSVMSLRKSQIFW